MPSVWSVKEISTFQTKILQVATQITAAATFVIAVNVAPLTALIMTIFLAVIFYTSKSIVNGLWNLFLSAAVTSSACSVFHVVQFNLGLLNWVMVIFFILSAIFVLVNQKILSSPSVPRMQFEFCLTGALLLSAVFLRQLSHLNEVSLFAMLLPEDNASWIGASNGFVRFNATVGEVASMENGTKYFLATVIAIVSGATSFTSPIDLPVISLISIANAYSLLILMLMTFVSAIAFHVFHLTGESNGRSNLFKSGKYALLGLILVVSVGDIFLEAGHLSLICGAFVLCATSFGFMETASGVQLFGGIESFWKLNIAFISSFAIGNAWLPLLPIALGTMLLSFVFVLRTKSLLPNERGAQRFGLSYILNLALFLFILLSLFFTLRIPSGYSISNLVLNSPGGTIVPTSITLSLSILGFVSIINVIGTNNFNSFYLPLMPLGLLSFWLFTLNSLPEQPGYSVEKFSMLVAIVGLPFFVGSIMYWYEKFTGNQFAHFIAPMLLTFAALVATWGINSFPRSAVLDKNNATLNFLPTLLDQSMSHPNAHILCVGTSSDGDMLAYTCSRFGSALQFREFGTGGLARRWRSQILGLNVDPKNISENENYLDQGLIERILNRGVELRVILIPGPKHLLDNRDDQPWIQDLPWDKIIVIQ